MTWSSRRTPHAGYGLRAWGVVAGVWSAVAAFSVSQVWIARAALGHPPPLRPLLLMELPVWCFWALLTVPIVMLSRRFPLDRAGAASSIAVHAGAAVAAALAAVGFQMLWYQAFNPYPLGGSSVADWYWQYFRQYFAQSFVLYWAAVGVYHAFASHRLYREQEMAASRAEAELGEARLQALRMQLRPHFLFNTLNSISALLEEQPAEARRVIAQLADLLRSSLRTDAVHVIPLEDELAFLGRYLEIERIRFGDRLQVSLDVTADARRAAIPSFLLQPLVENAIRHGVAQRESDGRMWLDARRRNGSLVIHVRDNGPGITPRPRTPGHAEASSEAPGQPSGQQRGQGIGLSNTRRRLEELYGPAHVLALANRPGGGVDVRVEIPFRTMEASV